MQSMEHIAPRYRAPSAHCAAGWSHKLRPFRAFAYPHRYQGGTRRSQPAGTACAYTDRGCLRGQAGFHDA